LLLTRRQVWSGISAKKMSYAFVFSMLFEEYSKSEAKENG